MIRRPPRSTHCISSAASDVYKRQPEALNEKVANYRRNSLSSPKSATEQKLTVTGRRVNMNRHWGRVRRFIGSQRIMTGEVVDWLQRHEGRRRHARNDGTEQLRNAVEHSFERLHSVKRGDLLVDVFRGQRADCYLPWRTAKRPSTSKSYYTAQNIPVRFFQNSKCSRAKSRNHKAASCLTSALKECNQMDGTHVESYRPYLKLYPLKELVQKVEENSAFSYKYASKGSGNRLPAQAYIDLVNKMCNADGKFIPIEAIKCQSRTPLDYTNNFALNVIKSCQKLEKTKKKLTKNLVSTLNAQRDNRPCTVDSKKRSISAVGKMRSTETMFSRVRVNSERARVECYKELAKEHGKAYYLLAKFILSNDYENDPDVVKVMDYFKGVAECGEKFGEAAYKRCIESIGGQVGSAVKPGIMYFAVIMVEY
eukprot:TRINITY_DN14341_c0_g1_i1.p1 TRINITY_DN14341_c0_g1~~TRINITY_DN14341_c0_g1_i1.p1  ORF type:complete len:432 (+),score=84.63 TRINITY_DN14341_c0_g1_i1:27-1298(+)